MPLFIRYVNENLSDESTVVHMPTSVIGNFGPEKLESLYFGVSNTSKDVLLSFKLWVKP